MKKTVFKGAATGLAGAVVIAGGSQAYGAVVSVAAPANYTPTSGASPGTVIPWDVNSDGTVDFDFQFYQASTNGSWVSGVYGIGGNLSVAYAGTYVTYVNRLSLGTAVSSSSAFYQAAGYVAVLASRFSGTFYGQFTNAGTPLNGWVGFEFTATDGLHYGAINVTTDRFRNAANPGGFRFLGAEYQTTPGAALTIQTVAVPEPTTLAALAFGGAGVAAAALRRRRKQAA